MQKLAFLLVRFAGPAPISWEVIEWYLRLGLELLEGYGMTGNMSYSHFCTPGQMRVVHVVWQV